MSALSQEDIQNALRSVVDPVTGKDLFSGGQIAGLVIKNRNVGFAIEIDPADAERMEPLRKAAERAAKQRSRAAARTDARTCCAM